MSWILQSVSGILAVVLLLLVPTRMPAQSSTLLPDNRPNAPVAKPDQPSPMDFRAIPEEGPYVPMDRRQRLEWIAMQTAGPGSLVGGLLTAGIGTANSQPREYGTHWDGFSKRYGMQFPGIATSNLLEAGLGAFWGEDTRYVRHGSDPLAKRLGHVFLMTVSARRRSGHLAPAYARYIAFTGSSFAANAWWAGSDSHASDALIRTGYGFIGRAAANAWDEFWPSLRPHLLPARR